VSDYFPRRSFFRLAGGGLLVPYSLPSSQRGPSEVPPPVDHVPPMLDHILLGCSELDAGIEFMEKKSGYRAALGGSHPGRGTRNAILALGYGRYLEILAPDPKQNGLTWHQEISRLTEPLLVGWALRSKNLSSYAARLRERGVECIGPIEGSRARPNGDVLRWKTLLPADDKSGMSPFYIEWDEHSSHPSADAPGACLLTDFHRSGHLNDGPAPRPGLKRALMPGAPAQLHAKFVGLFGEFELISNAVPSETWTPR
jgi:hypothetical protein